MRQLRAVRTRPAATRQRQVSASRPLQPLQQGVQRGGKRAQLQEAWISGAARRMRHRVQRRPHAGAAARQALRLALPLVLGRDQRAAQSAHT